jgi:hypothetical protein
LVCISIILMHQINNSRTGTSHMESRKVSKVDLEAALIADEAGTTWMDGSIDKLLTGQLDEDPSLTVKERKEKLLKEYFGVDDGNSKSKAKSSADLKSRTKAVKELKSEPADPSPNPESPMTLIQPRPKPKPKPRPDLAARMTELDRLHTEHDAKLSATPMVSFFFVWISAY